MPMRIKSAILVAVALVPGATFFAGRLGYIPAVHAQNACDAGIFTGGYGYALAGSAYDVQNISYVLASVGRIVSDGNGSFTGSDTFSYDGSIVQRKYTGTYTIKEDCTGSITL